MAGPVARAAAGRRPRVLAGLVPLIVAVATSRVAFAQESADTSTVRLPEIRIESARGSATDPSGAPFAVTVLAFAEPRSSDASAARLLGSIPGVFASDRGHWALGDRLTIRGMGARAGFGVRGVQVVLDGIPLSMPDGQAVTESIEPGVVRRLEVLRGPAARFWGNGSGGAVLVETVPVSEELRLDLAAGAFGRRSALAEWAVGARLRAWASYTRQDGFREHSGGRLVRGGLSGRIGLGRGGVLRFNVAAADQDVSAPGALTGPEALDDGRTADPRYVASSAGKRSTQAQAGIRLTASVGGAIADVSTYGVLRSLENPLPFAWIGVDRKAAGLRATWSRPLGPLRLVAGIDAGRQSDDRVNAPNDRGKPGIPYTVEQSESVWAYAASVFVSSTGPVSAHGGLRVDRIAVALRDRLPSDGDQSGSRAFTAWSPAIGLAASAGDWNFFADWSTAFETPTTTELVNRPDGLGGFNPRVGPQRTTGVEAGARSRGGRANVDVALFSLAIDDLLSSFESATDGRTYYANSGRAVSTGVEASVAWRPWPALILTLTGAAQRFRFVAGRNAVPGVPGWFGRIRTETRRGPFAVALVADVRGSIWADDANTVVEPRALSLDVELFSASGRIRPFVEVRNLTDRRFAASVIPNARGGRFIEPAPGRHLSAGISLRPRRP